MKINHIPSFCTACYRKGRTGEDFMHMVEDGKIVKCCEANALTTFKEYLEDYAGVNTKAKGEKTIKEQLNNIEDGHIKELTTKNLEHIIKGERDLTI